MNRQTIAWPLIAIGGVLLFLHLKESAQNPTPNPEPNVCPGPVCPLPQPAPRPTPLRPWNMTSGISLGGPVGPDGTEVVVDLPMDQRIRNIGSRVDGSGMCVNSSIEMAARWANLEQMRGYRDWSARYPGGSYSTKVDQQIRRWCSEQNIEIPPYIQYQGNDPEILSLALRTGRMACVTYAGSDGVLYRGSISHMVCLVNYDPLVAILDNNNIRDDQILWMDHDNFLRRHRATSGRGWLFLWLAPPPPPIPRSS